MTPQGSRTKTQLMSWYLAKIIYRITCGSGNHGPQFDEQLRLIAAQSEPEAFRRAVEIGCAGEDNFVNEEAQLVAWSFVDIAELHRLDTLLDGAELYSQVRETDDATDYINFVHYKSRCIRERLLTTN
jgi:hypothetical protein